MTQFLLIAHIGGTKARFGLKEVSQKNRPDEFLYKSRYPIGRFHNSTTMIENFIQEARDSLEYRADIINKIDISEITPKNIKVFLALAGTVDNNKCDILNWELSFDGTLLEKKLKFPKVDLINDFQAVAYGIRELMNDQEKHYYNFYSLTPKLGSTRQTLKLQKDEIIAVIGIATGLGKSFLIQLSDEEKAYSYATEGGHVNFAPRSQLEFLLFQHILNNIHDDNHCLLKDSYNRVSVERIVSGRGILAIYRFLQDCQNGLDKNTWFQKLPDRFKNEVNKIKEKLQSLKQEVAKSNLGIESKLDNLEKSGKYPLSQTAEDRILQKYQDRSLSLTDFLKELEKILEKGLDINSKKEKSKQKQEIIDKFSEPQVIEQLIKTWQQEDIQSPESVDPAPVITSAAIRKSDPLCTYTMQTFLEIATSVVRNCALHFMPYGGLYLAGGIPPQILPIIQKEICSAFTSEDEQDNKLTQIPIYVVKNLEAGLIGAAYYAENNLDKTSLGDNELNEKINQRIVSDVLKESNLKWNNLQKPEKQKKHKYSEKTPKYLAELPCPIGVINLGTNLREEFILKKTQDESERLYPTSEYSSLLERSHADFAARSLEEFELLEYIQNKENLDRISVEEVVSIKGIVRIYQFLHHKDSASERSEILQKFKTQILEESEFEEIKKLIENIEQIPEIDPEIDKKIEEADNKAIAIAIADAALAKSDLLCLKTMAMFVEAYGSEAGNFAVRLLPYEGLYLAGDITAKILQDGTWLQKLFLKEFNNKGRMTKIVKKIPLYFIKNEQVD